MRAILFAFSFFLVSCSKQDYEIEDESFACFSEISSGHDVKLDSLIYVIESNLVAEGQLNGTKGGDYESFLLTMQKENRTSHLASQESTRSLLELFNLPILINCRNRSEHQNYKGSTCEQLDKALANLASEKTLSPKPFANSFLNSLSSEHYSNLYYKTILWKLYAELFISGPDFSRTLPLKVSETGNNTETDCPRSYIELAENDVVSWNNVQTTNEALKDSILSFVKNSITHSEISREIDALGEQKVSNYIIYIRTYKKSSYGKYLQIQNTIKESINELRDEYALKFFEVEFSELIEEKKMAIKAIVGKHVIEATLSE